MKVVAFLKSNIFLILTNTRESWVGVYVNDPFYPNGSFNASIMTILEIHSYGVKYFKIPDDPVFPAKEWMSNLRVFHNNETLPRLLGCSETASICDPDMNSCWSFPEFGKFNYSFTPIPIWTITPKSFDSIGTDAELARALLYTAVFNNFLEPYYGNYRLEAESHCNYAP